MRDSLRFDERSLCLVQLHLGRARFGHVDPYCEHIRLRIARDYSRTPMELTHAPAFGQHSEFDLTLPLFKYVGQFRSRALAISIRYERKGVSSVQLFLRKARHC